MSVATKTGDDGSTGLWSGERVGKDDLRVECLGTVDELASFLGDARHAIKTQKARAYVEEVQEDLFRAAGALAAKDGAAYLEPICADDEERLSSWVYGLEQEVPVGGFVVPGSTPASAKLDICRTVCRRAERRVVALSRVERVDANVMRYMNRLSDLLFMLARYEEQSEGAIRFRRGTERNDRP